MKAEADPTVWKIVDGKLYVFSSTQAREKFEQDRFNARQVAAELATHK